MARATGSINYLEHRTPLKDESGKYQIHPMFVKQDVVDREEDGEACSRSLCDERFVLYLCIGNAGG